MSPTIYRKYEYFHSTVQTAEDGRQKFHLCRLPSDVTSCLIETLISSFGDLTTNGKPRFAVSGFTLAVCSYLGLKIRGLNSQLPCLFSFAR